VGKIASWNFRTGEKMHKMEALKTLINDDLDELNHRLIGLRKKRAALKVAATPIFPGLNTQYQEQVETEIVFCKETIAYLREIQDQANRLIF
jgi:hypothetical protein